MFPAALLCAFDRRAGSERGLARNSVGELVLERVPAPPASGAGPFEVVMAALSTWRPYCYGAGHSAGGK